MNFLFLISLLFLIQPNFSLASQSIQSGRPGQAIGAGTLDPGYIQIQSGLDHISRFQSIDNQIQTFNNVLRIGINPVFELSGLVNYEQVKFENTFLEQNAKGLSAFHIGFRSRVIRKQKGLIPQAVLQTRFKFNSVGTDFKSQNTAPIFTLATFHSLTKSLHLTTNLGLNTNGNTGKMEEFWVINFSKSLNAKANTFLEFYGNANENKSNVYFDTGFDYLLNNDTKIDFSVGYGENERVKDFLISVGISYRTKIF